MDDAQAKSAERLHAEFMGIPEQLSLALAGALFIPDPQSAVDLVDEAKAVSERALRSTAAVVNGQTVMLPELLAPGGALDAVLTAVMADIHGEQAHGLLSEESLAQLAVVLEKLVSFQISCFGTEELRHAMLLADKCIAELENKRGDDTAAMVKSMRAFRDWTAGILEVLSKAWKQHRVKIDADLAEGERKMARWCYSKATKLKDDCLAAVDNEESPTLLSGLTHFAAAVPDQLLVDRLPELAKPYCRNERWMENLRQSGKRLAVRLKKGRWAKPNCTGEEVFLYMVEEHCRSKDRDSDHNNYDAMIPDSDDDIVRRVERRYIIGSDVIKLLYGGDCCDLDALDRMEWLADWDTYPHPAEWFRSYKSKPFTNHVIISPDCRAQKVEHAITVLGKARQPLPEDALHKVVSYLDDNDIIRLTCCGKGS